MTLQALKQAILWPGLTPGWSGTPATAAGSTLTAAGHYQANVYCATEDMVISHVGWRPNSVSGSPTADVRIETVAATGFPSGTLWAANTNLVTGTLTAAWRLDALTASATITKGQMFAVVLAYASGTNFVTRLLSTTSMDRNVPYRAFSVGTPTVAASTLALMALGSNSTTFYSLPGTYPVATLNANTFNNTNSAARGNKFQVPFKCTASGLCILTGASLGDLNIALYDSSGAELSSSLTAFDGDQGAGAVRMKHLYFDNTVDLSPGTNYYMAQEPSSATNVLEYVWDLPSADYLKAMPGGANFAYATRASGIWTDDTDSVCLMDLLISKLSDDAGGGSGTGISRARGAAGGM